MALFGKFTDDKKPDGKELARGSSPTQIAERFFRTASANRSPKGCELNETSDFPTSTTELPVF
jgi:hypothetical protein